MKEYKAIFFDLDHTLWDFDRNSEEAIAELYADYQLAEKGVTGFDEFINTYREINRSMWDAYHRHEISKVELRNGRFYRSLLQFDIKDSQLAERMATAYLQISPHKTNLFPGAIQTLEFLASKYKMHIITNGFKEVQYIKIKKSGLDKFFDCIHISEEVGFKKPEPEIFHLAVSKAGSTPDTCIMIGDNIETDINGAKNAGIDSVHFNPDGARLTNGSHHVIQELDQLKQIL